MRMVCRSRLALTALAVAALTATLACDRSRSGKIRRTTKTATSSHFIPPIGADGDDMAVLDSHFRVRGTERLRDVDASVFPKIFGFFIASSIYTVAEKAADAILADV